jgi:fumarate reductase subunit C
MLLTPESRWPAYLDVVQSLTGLLLSMFMWFHMAFVSTILISPAAFGIVTRMFEGSFLFNEPVPMLVSAIVAIVWLLVAIHAVLALLKFPSSWHQYRQFRLHMQSMAHQDTSLWLVQLSTGFIMFFLVPIHLYTMMMHPEEIGPYTSSLQVWQGNTWPMLLALLVCVELHGVIGLYRLALKWGWPTFGAAERTRRILRCLMWLLITLFIAVGLMTMATFIQIGQDQLDGQHLATPHYEQHRENIIE